MKTLFAGPWVGEFGYELFEWQGYLRQMKDQYGKIIISSQPGHEILYKDFCDDYIPYQSDVVLCVDRRNGKTSYNKELEDKVKCDVRIYGTSHLNGKARYVIYGNKKDELKYDIIIHARHINAPKVKVGGSDMGEKNLRNYPQDKWEELVDRFINDGLKVCSIGAPEAAMHIKGTDDKRGIPLEQLADLCRSSRLTIGPSSGPMHFASLCNCPHFVWSYPGNKRRYLEQWNPHKTPVYFYDKENWHPKVDNLYRLIKDII